MNNQTEDKHIKHIKHVIDNKVKHPKHPPWGVRMEDLLIQEQEEAKKIYNDLPENELIERIGQYPFCIQYVTDPPKHIQLIAIERHVYSVCYINYPCKEAQIKAIELCNDLELLRYFRDYYGSIFTDPEASRLLLGKIGVLEILKY